MAATSTCRPRSARGRSLRLNCQRKFSREPRASAPPQNTLARSERLNGDEISLMQAIANIDGQLLPLAEAKISALDRGFLFGDAVYEVLRVYAGRPWLADEHFARLARSLDAIRIPGIDIDRMR